MRQSLCVWVLMPSLRPGSCIQAFHRESHGRCSGCFASRLLARTFEPRCVSASMVPMQTCVSLEFFGRATYFGTSPSSGHSAQQSGCWGGSCMGMILRFGIILIFYFLLSGDGTTVWVSAVLGVATFHDTLTCAVGKNGISKNYLFNALF